MFHLDGDGAQGRDRTTDTVIFSHVLYQLSYLGIAVSGGLTKRSDPLIVALAAVQTGLVDRRAGNAIAIAEPLEQVAILAAAAAEWRVLRGFRFSAKRAFLGIVRGFRHTRRTWEG